MRDLPTRAAGLGPALEAAARGQSGLLLRSQLLELGVSRHELAAQVRARRWRLVGDVAVLHRGALSRSEQCWFAILHAGPPGRAGLAALTALEVAGLRGWPRTEIHVLVRKSTWARPRSGIVVHESRRFAPDQDLVRLAGVPCTGVARSAIDAAAWSRAPRTAAGLLAACVQQRLCTPRDLAAALASAGRVRHVALMRTMVADLGGGADSLAELDMARLIRRAGLPPPRRQVARMDTTGRRRYLDLEVGLPDGTELVIEVDGAHHLDPTNWWADQERQNDLTVAGRLFARYPAAVVRTDPDGVVASLARIARPHLELS